MQRSRLVVGLTLAFGLLSTQCESLSEDCRKTLTCGDAGAPVLSRQDCTWRLPDGGIWEDGPVRRGELWVWPNGEPLLNQTFECLTPNDPGGGPGNCTTAVNPAEGETRCEPPLLCDPASRNCVQCITHEDCSGDGAAAGGAGPYCDPSARVCVPCLEDEHCEDEADTPLCRAREQDPAANNRCVECLNDADCPDSGACDEATNECTLRCTTPNDCRGDKPVCDTDAQLCVECLSNTECAAGGLECNTQTKTCVECASSNSAACENGEVCDTADGQCVQCVTDEQCGGPRPPRCDSATNDCVDCVNHLHCTSPTASRCNTATQTCAPCNDNVQCELGAPFCRDNGECVECLEESHCAQGEHCNIATGRCEECVQDAHCPTADAARCNTTTFTCDVCIPNDANGNAECSNKPGVGPLCRPGDGACVNCLGAGDCFPNPNASLCNNDGNCVPCTQDQHCDLFTPANSSESLRACRINEAGNSCVECTNDNHCVAAGGPPVCKVVDTLTDGPAPLNTCVECVENSDCGSPGASRCVQNTCVACEANADCSHLSGLGVCDAGECVECTGQQRQACNGFVCDSLARECTTFGVGDAQNCDVCVSDDHCVSNARCVEQTFGNTDVGFFCFPLQQDGLCPIRGFARATNAVTIDGDADPICAQNATTCPAFDDYSELQACQDESDDAACGVPNLADGACVLAAPGFVCTIRCSVASDCAAGLCTGDQCPQ